MAADQQKWVLKVARRVQRPATDISQKHTVPASIGNVDLNSDNNPCMFANNSHPNHNIFPACFSTHAHYSSNTNT